MRYSILWYLSLGPSLRSCLGPRVRVLLSTFHVARASLLLSIPIQDVLPLGHLKPAFHARVTANASAGILVPLAVVLRTKRHQIRRNVIPSGSSGGHMMGFAGACSAGHARQRSDRFAQLGVDDAGGFWERKFTLIHTLAARR